jgi:hypothetical protein
MNDGSAEWAAVPPFGGFVATIARAVGPCGMSVDGPRVLRHSRPEDRHGEVNVAFR